ncbi:MAG: hypothetical protein ACRDGE_01220 [Candidatus Limnocylindria bacterium]
MVRLAGIPLAALALIACATPAGIAAPDPAATSTPVLITAAPPASAAPPTDAGATAASPTTAPTDALLALIRSGALPPYKITYAMTTVGPGAAGSPIVAWTQVYGPPRFRFDMTTSQGGTTRTITTIATEEAFYLCTDLPGQESCLEFPSAEDASMFQPPQAPQPIPDDLSGWDIAPHETRLLLGVTARCYAFSAPGTAASSSTGCYSPEGVPLLVSSIAAGVEFTMTATDFSTTVSDADFALPYPVSQPPGYGAP